MTKPLFDVLRQAMMNNPDGSRKEQQDAFVQMVTADTAYFEMLAIDYFERMSAPRMVVRDRLGVTFARTGASQDAIDRASQSRSSPPAIALVRRSPEVAAEQTAVALDEMRAKLRSVVLLDLVLPNGKALRDATGAECAKAGGFFADVAKSVTPSQVVGKHRTEGELQNIKARFFQKNTKDAA